MSNEKLQKILDNHELWLSNKGGKRANLSRANLSGANLSEANLSWADLLGADLSKVDLSRANLSWANLSEADLSWANLLEANLLGAKGLVKIMGVEQGNYYWKAIEENLTNNDYRFKIGLNTLREGEIFADDERVLCSYPGFHFASKSWCKREYGDRPYLCKIRIPENAKINEPWATDGKASADKIEIVQILDMKTEEDITEQFKQTK